MILFLLACSDKGDDSNPVAADDSAVTDDSATPPPPFTLYSPDFDPSAGDPLHAECDFLLTASYACGEGNPEIRWDNAPSDTVSFALVFDDPDAGNFPHWAIYDIPATVTGLDGDISGEGIGVGKIPKGAVELENGHGTIGYYGSCPPAPHVYRWRLWALRDTIGAMPPAAKGPPAQFAWLETQASGLAYDMAETCHIYNP
jgi:Raf kinase inhibitor-like YbhB/YbcL family protein